MHRLYESLKEETKEPLEASVTGSIPEWLNGSLYRTGPGIFEVGDNTFDHWFDGLAVIHRFHVSGGKAYYQNKHLDSEAYEKNIAANRIALTTFGTVAYPDPCKSVFRRFFCWWCEKPEMDPGDNANVAMFSMGDNLMVTSETNKLVHIDKKTLGVKGNIDLTETASILMTAAHPHIDGNGTLHSMGASKRGGYSYAIYKMTPANGGKAAQQEAWAEVSPDPSTLQPTVEVLNTFTPQWRFYPSYYHSFGLTDNYYVFVEQPMVINVFKLLYYVISRKPAANAFEWWNGYPTKLHIIDRHTGQKVNKEWTYQAETFMAMHTVNAYEHDDQIVVDMCCYDAESADFFKNTYLQQFRKEKQPGEKASDFEWANLKRFVLPLNLESKENWKNLATIKFTSAQATVDTVKKKVQCIPQNIATGIEMPQINYKSFNSRRYTCMYGIGPDADRGTKYLKKVNVESMEELRWAEDECVPSEPIFVASPDSTEEDDGVVLSLILTTHEKDRYAFLLILNAKDFTEIARAKVNVELPLGIHGTFVHDM